MKTGDTLTIPCKVFVISLLCSCYICSNLTEKSVAGCRSFGPGCRPFSPNFGPTPELPPHYSGIHFLVKLFVPSPGQEIVHSPSGLSQTLISLFEIEDKRNAAVQAIQFAGGMCGDWLE